MTVVNVKNMLIKPEIEILNYKEEYYRRHPKWLHHLHPKYFFEIKTTLPEPFHFLDGSNTYEISSCGKNMTVDPIPFKIA